MNDSMIPTSRLISCTLWGVVIALVAGGWVAAILDDWKLGLMLGLTACATSAGAAAWQVRCYILRAVRIVLAAMKESGPGGRRTVQSMRRTD